MGKFMIATFLILGWGFYELSGGADFVPDVAPNTQSAAATQITINDTEVTRNDTTSLIRVNAEVTPASLDVAAPNAVADAVAAAVIADTPAITETVVAEPAPAPLDLRAVAGSRVNMRSGPGTDYAVLDTLPGGTQAEVIEVNADGWARIRVLDTEQVGWMAERLLTNG